MKRLFLLFSLLSILPCFVHADAPQVLSFAPTQSFVSNDYSVVLEWNIPAGSGQSILFQCPLGVTMKDAAGANVDCGVRHSVGSATTNNAAFTITNLNSSTKTVTATLYPHASNGSDYDAGALSTSLQVGPIAQILTDFSSATSSIASGGSVTFSWAGIDTPGVNFTLECGKTLTFAISGSLDPIPCGQPIFASQQGQSGSLSVQATNTSLFDDSFTLHILPAITANTYDATRGQDKSVIIKGAVPESPPKIATFSGTPATVYSGDLVTVSWDTTNAKGANIILSCASGVTFVASSTVSTSTLPCGSTALAAPLSTTGTFAFVPTNTQSYGQTITATLLPQDKTGGYLGYAGVPWQFKVREAGATRSKAPQGGTDTAGDKAVSYTPIVETQTSGLSKSDIRPKFTTYLTRGSRGSEVKRLQQFLAENPAIYPEGLATGYYGAATAIAVGRFQDKYGIAHKGDAGYGSFGPKTRAVINIAPEP